MLSTPKSLQISSCSLPNLWLVTVLYKFTMLQRKTEQKEYETEAGERSWETLPFDTIHEALFFIAWLSHSSHFILVTCRRPVSNQANISVSFGFPTDSTNWIQWIIYKIVKWKKLRGDKVEGDILRVFVGVTWESGIEIIKTYCKEQLCDNKLNCMENHLLCTF